MTTCRTAAAWKGADVRVLFWSLVAFIAVGLSMAFAVGLIQR